MELQKTGVELIRSGNKKKTIEFSIGNSGIIIDILRNKLYSKPIQTLVQEYISNAIDANREMGLTGKEILIQAPTKTSPLFKVKDKGPGLSESRIEEIFTKYGNSTKRDSNEQIGGFGIGSKSGWAYTPAFTVRSCYEGKKTTYLAHLGGNSAGVLERISEEPTEDRGVEIEISVNTDKQEDIVEFHKAIARMLLFREDPPQLIEVPPEYKNLYIAPSVNYSPLVFDEIGGLYHTGSSFADTHHKTSIICIDGIPYDVEDRDFYGEEIQTLFGFWYLLQAKTGELQVSASREKIVIDEQFKAFLKKKGKDLKEKFKEHVLKEFTSCKALTELVGKNKDLLNTLARVSLKQQEIVVAGVKLTWEPKAGSL